MATSGYSNTQLARKLGIKEGFTVLLVNPPSYYFDLFSDFPNVLLLKFPQKGAIDFIHLFCTEREDFEERSLVLKPALSKNGMLWVSWPKGSSKINTDLSRDVIREYLLEKGLVDVKVCSVDEDWSGLRFVFRLKDRK